MIKFDKYYSGDWPYHESQGVGLRLSGVPTDIIAFIDLMQSESCNPVATRRILNDLEKNGEKYTTVMSFLNFNYIGDMLAQIGVIMEIIPPKTTPDYDPNKTSEIDSLVKSFYHNPNISLSSLTIEEQSEFQERLQIFKNSLNETPHHFGMYDTVPTLIPEELKEKKLRY